MSSLDGASSNQTIMPQSALLTENVFQPIQCLEKDTRPQITMRGQYWVFYNYVPAEKKFKCNETVTYTTHCDHTFLDNLVPLLKRYFFELFFLFEHGGAELVPREQFLIIGLVVV